MSVWDWNRESLGGACETDHGWPIRMEQRGDTDIAGKDLRHPRNSSCPSGMIFMMSTSEFKNVRAGFQWTVVDPRLHRFLHPLIPGLRGMINDHLMIQPQNLGSQMLLRTNGPFFLCVPTALFRFTGKVTKMSSSQPTPAILALVQRAPPPR